MYNLAGYEFKTKKAIEIKIRGIVAAYQDGESLHDIDFDIVCALLEWHPDSEQKVGVGVKCIKKVISPTWKTEGLKLIRVDETSTDFSWRQCLRPKTKLSDVKRACREAVKGQIFEFRDNYRGAVSCPITGEELAVSDMHVDHAPPNTFVVIFDAWVKVHELDIANVKLKGHGDNNEIVEFADPKLAKGFVVFHRLNANLRMVSPEGNYQVERDFGRKNGTSKKVKAAI